jgi:phage replication-related protein YjqB (UPF0714/DUF867 family)
MDKYKNFKELSKNECENKDFQIRQCPRDDVVAIIAPHGGKIEPNTSGIAEAIAGDGHSSYFFEGLKPDNNQDLHITSTNFDEPLCLELVASSDIVVAVHGLAGPESRIDVGGRDQKRRDAICKNLIRAGFTAAIVSTGDHAATNPDNICNRGRSGMGVQLEITRGLRDRLKGQDLAEFANAVRNAIK